MTEREITVTNSLGIHARPASMIVKTALGFSSNISLIKDDVTADAKSIMSVMMLAAVKGSTILLKTEGPDEEDAAEAIVQMFADNFKEK